MTQKDKFPMQIRAAVQDALSLLETVDWDADGQVAPEADPLPSLLEQCGEFASSNQAADPEPIRTIHHFSCTGGTLIAKCLACSPNAQALSELDPLSSKTSAAGHFNPTDLIQLLQFGNRGASMEDKLGLFTAGFKALYDAATAKGLRILVRDHTHSHFCVGAALPERPTLAEILEPNFSTVSIITVRHPLDSWLSLANNRWIEFSPPTLNEYARRYLAFLAAYPDTRRFKYEDFVASPDEVLSEMCAELLLPFPSDYKDLYMVHQFSGDSGRKGDVISQRERRPVTDDLLAAANASPLFQSLCQQLQYVL